MNSLPEDIKAMQATLHSPGWRLIHQRVLDRLRERKGMAHAASDPFMSGKLNGEIFGWEACLGEIAAAANYRAPLDEGEEYTALPEGADQQLRPGPKTS